MKRLRWIVLFLLLSSLLCTLFQKPVVFQGCVFNKDNMQPVSGVAVRIMETEHETRTDDSGNYIFTGLKPRDAVLVFEHINFEKTVIQAVVLEPGRTYRTDVALVPVV
jgi:hypothetical protein